MGDDTVLKFLAFINPVDNNLSERDGESRALHLAQAPVQRLGTGMFDEELKQSNILIIDDQPANISLLEQLLSLNGFRNTRSTTDSRKTLELYRESTPD